MKFPRSQISIFLITLSFWGCFEAPEFSDTPVISFNSIVFSESASGADSLLLRFDFEDGDGDIGLSPNETFAPFHPINFVFDSRDSIVTYSDPFVEPPFYLVDPLINVTFFSDTDNRPLFNCSDYQVIDADTFYIQKNEFHTNMHIAFERKRNGEYTPIDFSSEFSNANCAAVDFNGRIPIFESENIGNSISGTISYSMLSAGFPVIFRADTIRLQFYIYDRDLNVSNTVMTPDFTLGSITREVN